MSSPASSIGQWKFRSGQMQLCKVPVGASSSIRVGDLVYLDGGIAKPAGEFPFGANAAATQVAFAKVFLGVAYEASTPGAMAPISVDTSPLSVYEFSVALNDYAVGQTLAPAAAQAALESQTLTATADPAAAIARSTVSTRIQPGGTVVTSAPTVTLHVMFASAFHVASSNRQAQVAS